MKRLPWKYLAGLIDGEGCIDLQVTKSTIGPYVNIRPRLRIAMTLPGKHVLEMAQNSYGGHLYHRKTNNSAWTDSYSWECVGYKNASMVLRNVVNHLLIKREQARFCLWMENNIKGRHVSTEVRDAIRKEMKLMKSDPHRLSERAQEKILVML